MVRVEDLSKTEKRIVSFWQKLVICVGYLKKVRDFGIRIYKNAKSDLSDKGGK
jgi:hypothetical protein